MGAPVHSTTAVADRSQLTADPAAFPAAAATRWYAVVALVVAVIGWLVAAGPAAAAFSPMPGSPFAGSFSPHLLRVADVNGDGRPDVIETQSVTHGPGVVVMLGTANGLAAPVAADSGSVPPDGLAVGDVTGDGRPDIVRFETSGL